MLETRIVPFTFLLFGLTACGDDGDCPGSVGGNSLDGSYCAFDDLSFDAVRVTYFESNNDLDIRYGNGRPENLSPQLTVSVFGGDEIQFGPGRIDGDELFVQAFRDGATSLTPLDLNSEQSNLVLDDYDGIGSRARGEINLLINLDSGSGTGRAVTLNGEFEGTVLDGESFFGGGDGG